jgi:hypothetical protein
MPDSQADKSLSLDSHHAHRWRRLSWPRMHIRLRFVWLTQTEALADSFFCLSRAERFYVLSGQNPDG